MLIPNVKSNPFSPESIFNWEKVIKKLFPHIAFILKHRFSQLILLSIILLSLFILGYYYRHFTFSSTSIYYFLPNPLTSKEHTINFDEINTLNSIIFDNLSNFNIEENNELKTTIDFMHILTPTSHSINKHSTSVSLIYSSNDIYSIRNHIKNVRKIIKENVLPYIPENVIFKSGYLLMKQNRLNITLFIFIYVLILIGTLIILSILYYFQNRIYRRKHLNSIEIPVLGTVMKHNYKKYFLVSDSPKNVVSENIRYIITRIIHSIKDINNEKIILITSSIPNEGKSFMSINIAILMASIGKKTLLFECDLRKPKLHSRLGISNTEGVSSYLISKSSIENILSYTGIENLSFLSAGPIPPNPSELLYSEKAKELFQRLRSLFDIIIVDSPPVLSVVDACVLTSYCDFTILVVRSGTAKIENIEASKTILENAKGNILGCILNCVDFRLGLYKFSRVYFRGFGYGYGYGYGGSGYGYGYGEGYFNEDKKPKKRQSLLKRIFSKIR